MMPCNVLACIMRHCLSESSFSRRKTHIVYAEVQRRIAAEVPGIRYIRPSDYLVSASHMHRWYEVRKIRYLIGETCSGQDVLTAKLRLFYLVSLSRFRPVILLSVLTLLYSPSTGFANYLSLGTLILHVRR